MTSWIPSGTSLMTSSRQEYVNIFMNSDCLCLPPPSLLPQNKELKAPSVAWASKNIQKMQSLGAIWWLCTHWAVEVFASRILHSNKLLKLFSLKHPGCGHSTSMLTKLQLQAKSYILPLAYSQGNRFYLPKQEKNIRTLTYECF